MRVKVSHPRTQQPQTGLEMGPFNPKSSASMIRTIGPLHLLQRYSTALAIRNECLKLHVVLFCKIQDSTAVEIIALHIGISSF